MQENQRPHTLPNLHTSTTKRARSIVHPFFDFWLLGGASVAIWLIMKGSDWLREGGGSQSLDQRFLQIGITFSLLSLVCNHPHFIMSYQMSYGRGVKFIRQNWFAMIFVPLALVAIFTAAFFTGGNAAASGWIVDAPNAVLEFLGVGFRFGLQGNLSDELMGSAIWLMYLTVGWHYSKQVFGCMMVYAHYDTYSIGAIQRWIIKGSVFSVAFLQFTYLYKSQTTQGIDLGVLPAVHSIQTPLELPAGLYTLSIFATVMFFTATIVGVFIKNYREAGRLPSANFIIPWVALHVWWVPFFKIPEFTFLMVPFFHSLQYLPFAYRVGTPKFARNTWYYSKITAHAVGILVIGFLAFEGLPSAFDGIVASSGGAHPPLFFITAFAVFINVHHFFIDSVSWKMKDAGVRAALFEDTVNVTTEPTATINPLTAPAGGMAVAQVSAEVGLEKRLQTRSHIAAG